MFNRSWLRPPLSSWLSLIALSGYGLSYTAWVPLDWAPWLHIAALGFCLKTAPRHPFFWYYLHGSAFLSLYWLAHPLYLMLHFPVVEAYGWVALLILLLTYAKAAPMVWIQRHVPYPYFFVALYWACFEIAQVHILEFPSILWSQLQGTSPLLPLFSPLPPLLWIVPTVLLCQLCLSRPLFLLLLPLLWCLPDEGKPLPEIRLAVVQGNIDKSLIHRLPFWDRAFYHDLFLARYQEMSLDQKSDVIIWPECIFGSVAARSRTDLMDALPLVHPSIPLILGASFNESGYENTAVLLLPGHAPMIRSKAHGAPFAEQTPHWLYPIARRISPHVAPPSMPTDEHDRLFPLTLHGRTYHFLTVICYESGFLSYERIPKETDLILILSENIWFQSGTAERQQLNFAQLVAHRHHRPVILASNNGITAWIDAQGHVQASLKSNTHDVLLIAPSSATQDSEAFPSP